MLHINEKNTTTLYNYENSKKLKTNKKDFFSFFKNISNVQELWIKSILFDKNYFLVPFSTNLQNINFNSFNNFYCTSETNKTTQSNIKFVIANKKGSFLGLISLIYLHEKKIIYINKIDYVR